MIFFFFNTCNVFFVESHKQQIVLNYKVKRMELFEKCSKNVSKEEILMGWDGMGSS